MSNLPAGEDDSLNFIDEDTAATTESSPRPWKIMIVDDEPGVHAATRLALHGISFRGRGLELISAYSGAEAMTTLRAHCDTAMILLDVVMETDDAGLRVARQIREEGFNLTRIVLRTGHPGYAPEREVVVNYDIHDYKEKTSLDFSKLFSCLISALRAYDDLVAIEHHRRGLVSVLEAVSWFDFRSLKRYLSRMLAELSSLANIEVEDLLLAVSPSDRAATADDFTVLIDGLSGTPLNAAEHRFIADAMRVQPVQGCVSGETGALLLIRAFKMKLAFYTRDKQALISADLALLELFLNKVAQALDNHQTFAEILNERDTLVRNAVTQNVRWGDHEQKEIRQIQRLTRETAARLQQKLDFPDEIDDWFVFSIGTASGLHDLGLQSLPHQLFEKTERLNDEERQSIQHHTELGVEMLENLLGRLENSRLFGMAENVLRQHHERYDGSGYPVGLVGNAIALPARIVAVVDTYVAMCSPRPYRPAHNEQEVVAFLAGSSGSLFDPRVIDAFLDIIASPT